MVVEVLRTHPVTPSDSADTTYTSQGEEEGQEGQEEAGVEESEQPAYVTDPAILKVCKNVESIVLQLCALMLLSRVPQI